MHDAWLYFVTPMPFRIVSKIDYPFGLEIFGKIKILPRFCKLVCGYCDASWSEIHPFGLVVRFRPRSAGRRLEGCSCPPVNRYRHLCASGAQVQNRPIVVVSFGSDAAFEAVRSKVRLGSGPAAESVGEADGRHASCSPSTTPAALDDESLPKRWVADRAARRVDARLLLAVAFSHSARGAGNRLFTPAHGIAQLR
jgi:hypothetical protein